MSLRVRHINADTTWLLTFSPLCAGENPHANFPGSFTILLDPWILGASTVFSPRFAYAAHTMPACVESLADLPEPDLVLVSQDKSDHCNEATLRQLSPHADTLVVGPPAAAKKIRSWKHFDPLNIQSLKRFDPKRDDTVFRIPIPPFSSNGCAGEVTISLIANKLDVTGLHNAIGITYRPPSSVFSAKTGSYVNLPLTPPTTPPASSDEYRPLTPNMPGTMTVYPSPFGNREKTLSVIYSPHGVNYSTIKPYATSFLMSQAALPLTTLFHCFDRSSNPWYLGGVVCAGSPNGIEIAHSLYAKSWIGAHDEEKDTRGVSTKALKVEKSDPREIKHQLDMLARGSGNKSGSHTQVLQLDVGQDYIISAK